MKFFVVEFLLFGFHNFVFLHISNCLQKGASSEYAKCNVATWPPSLHYYCAVVLNSCTVLPPVCHSSNHQYHCCQLTRQSICVSYLFFFYVHVASGAAILYYYCAVVLRSCTVLPPVCHSSNHQYHCCQLT